MIARKLLDRYKMGNVPPTGEYTYNYWRVGQALQKLDTSIKLTSYPDEMSPLQTCHICSSEIYDAKCCLADESQALGSDPHP